MHPQSSKGHARKRGQADGYKFRKLHKSLALGIPSLLGEMLFLMTGRSWWRKGLLAAGLVPWAAAVPPERAAIDRLPRPLAQTTSAQKIAGMLAQKDA